MQTYLISGVVMDIAAFKVSYSIGCDIDTTALRAARARSGYIHRGNGGNVRQGSKCKNSPTGTQITSTCTAVGQFKGHSSRGRWMKVQGEFKMQAHIISGVFMDIAAFKVSHSIGIDIDATALRAARASSSSIHRGDG